MSNDTDRLVSKLRFCCLNEYPVAISDYSKDCACVNCTSTKDCLANCAEYKKRFANTERKIVDANVQKCAACRMAKVR